MKRSPSMQWCCRKIYCLLFKRWWFRLRKNTIFFLHNSCWKINLFKWKFHIFTQYRWVNVDTKDWLQQTYFYALSVECKLLCEDVSWQKMVCKTLIGGTDGTGMHWLISWHNCKDQHNKDLAVVLLTIFFSPLRLRLPSRNILSSILLHATH